jgi:mannose/fructose/N-acetylgalactosamine-specific phosphotransferase system component IIC
VTYSPQQRRQYDTISSIDLPINSGMMVSAIRRVINLCLMASIYWLEETVEAMLKNIPDFIRKLFWNNYVIFLKRQGAMFPHPASV